MADAANPALNSSYTPFSWMFPLITGSYKPEDKVEIKSGETENESLPLALPDLFRKASLIGLAQFNLSYAIAQECTLIRDLTISDSEANILKKAVVYVITPAILAVMSVCVVIEAVVRKVLGMMMTGLTLCRPPAPSTKKEEDAKEGKKAPEKKEDEIESKSLYQRHVEMCDKNSQKQAVLNGAISFGIFAITDLLNTMVASLNPFHATSDIKPSVGVTGALVPFLLSTAEGVAMYAARTFEIMEDFHDNGKEVDWGITEGAPLGLFMGVLPGVTPLFGMVKTLAPLEFGRAYIAPFTGGGDGAKKAAAVLKAANFVSVGTWVEARRKIEEKRPASNKEFFDHMSTTFVPKLLEGLSKEDGDAINKLLKI